MPAPVFIGDEVTAAAYRLAGIATRVPGWNDVERVFHDALKSASLVLITTDLAAGLPEGELTSAVRRASPLVLVVPDSACRHLPADLDRQVDGVLGIER